MQRETKSIVSPTSKEVVLKTYLTARERNALRAVYLEKMRLNPDSESKVDTSGVGGSVVELSEHKLIELAVVSYDKHTSFNAILEALLNGSPEEYDFVVAEANKISTGSLTQAK